MKKQTVRLKVSGNSRVSTRVSGTKEKATASQANGGTITLKGKYNGN